MLREPFPAPIQKPQYHQPEKIAFKHPAYCDQLGDDTLFILWAWDLPDGGLHHGTALLACILVSCNATNGYLSKDKAGLEPVPEAFDKDLPVGSAYYFHVPHPDIPSSGCNTPSTASPPGTSSPGPYKYPVYADFDHWRYPHDTHNFPPWMKQMMDSMNESQQQMRAIPSDLDPTAAAFTRDEICLLTGEGDSLDRAHICPRAAQKWFRENSMQQYNDGLYLSGSDDIDDLANALTMSSGRCRAFNAGNFVIVYKYGAWVSHFMELTTHYTSQHHNRPVALPCNVAPEFLLARFAWTLFPRIRGFLGPGVPRLVRVREKNALSGQLEEVDKLLSEQDITGILQTGREQSPNPRKRSASDAADHVLDSPKRGRRGRRNFSP
jgi:hypothetical protein